MKTKLAVLLLVLASFGYLAISLNRAFLFNSSQSPLGFLFSISILAVSGVSGYLIYREIKFGRQMQMVFKAAKAAELEVSVELPLAPSGKPNQLAADKRFEELMAELGPAGPTSWQEWLKVAVAYDDARDRKRARAAMRTCIGLYLNSENESN